MNATDRRVVMMVERGQCEGCPAIPNSLFQVDCFVVCVKCLDQALKARGGRKRYPDNAFINPRHPDYIQPERERSVSTMTDAIRGHGI